MKFAKTSLVATIGALALAGAAQAAPTYRIIDLGTLPGYDWRSGAIGINNAGQVVGYSSSSSTNDHRSRAFLWSASSGMQDLGTLPGDGSSSASGINNAGQVVGNSGAWRPFLWSASSGMQDLGENSSIAHGINDAGQVVGYGSTTGEGWWQAFLWTASGGMQGLGSMGGDYYSVANGINDAGQVVGSTSSERAFLWSASSGMQDLGTLPGDERSVANGINNAGQVVGNSSSTSDYRYRAFLWSASGGMQDLGTLSGLPGDDASFAHGINNAGQVVGENFGFSEAASDWLQRAFLWSPTEGMLDLNSLIDTADPLRATTFLSVATAINDAGQIVGYANFNGVTRAFLLTPVPEPETYALFLSGLGVLGLMARSGRRNEWL